METTKTKVVQETAEITTKQKNDLEGTPYFEQVKPMLTTPLEITRDKLRIMNTIDETSICIS
mgnify:CR=1 FL=1